jgi:hypothetical protein
VIGDRTADNPTTAYDDRLVLFANSSPFGTGVPGLLHVMGHTNPGAQVTVTATSGVQSVAQAVTATTSDAAGTTAGDFEVALRVTDLGTHFAGTNGSCGEIPTPPSCNPMSTNPEDWGPSALSVTTVARAGDSVSETLVQAVTKYAGTPRDTYAPMFRILKGSSPVPGLAANSPMIAWPPCNWFHYTMTAVQNASSTEKCGQAYQLDNTSVAYAWGGATDSSQAYGIDSEIGDVKITVASGEDIVFEGSSAYRVGAGVSWSQPLYIDQFVPNPPPATTYVATVLVRDAWGNLDDFGLPLEASNPFRVWPL